MIAGYNEAGTAVIDPRSGDVWALSSAPLFNPNAMTIGTTLSGTPLAAPSEAARLNHATLAAYPAGSSFKVFTLAAALKTGVASPATRMTCSGTWTYSGFTFHNYLEHTLPGFVDLLEAMAFSCNTTYMPLSINVYQQDQHALTDLVRQFGFGHSTGIRHLADEPGILPDPEYFRQARRGTARSTLRPVRPDPAGHRAGELPGHTAAAGQRLCRHRQRRPALDAAHRGGGAPAGRHRGRAQPKPRASGSA